MDMISPLSIGIEACGKSFTVVTLADATGRIYAAVRDPTRLNYHEGTKPSLGSSIYRFVKNILESCNVKVEEFCRDQGKICAGITGVTTKFDRKNGMEDVWRRAGLAQANTKISTGGIEIEFMGATRSLRGAALSCHTGSAAMARTEHVIRRVGGWGPMIGDEGSGYWIGSKAINAICRLRDERDSHKTRLATFVREELEAFPVWNDILRQHETVSNSNWVDAFVSLVQRTRDSKEYRYIVSDISRAVFKTLEDDPEDVVAKKIVLEARDLLLEQVQSAIQRVQLPSDIPLVLRGGVIKYNEMFAALIKARANELWPQMELIFPTDSRVMRPAVGALLFALSGSMFSLPPPEVQRNLQLSAEHFPALAND